MGTISMGDLSSIWPCATVRADNGGHVFIGSATNVQEHVGIHSGEAEFPVEIGDHSTIAHGALIHGAKIGNFVCVGIGAIVLNGATIPDFVLIGANSVVPEGACLESGALYVGSPAKPVRALSNKQRLWLKHAADIYIALTRQSLGLADPTVSHRPTPN
jgi:carbonic anhydrase/acetyltransferase-like protein (isoleucine patch superfamily)